MKLFFSAFLFCTSFLYSFHLSLCQVEDLPYCEEVFVEAFSKAYENFSEKDLGVQDKRAFLKAAIADVYEDYEGGEQTLIVAKDDDGKVLGFASFKATEIPYQIYIAQLAVDPQYWNNGIGKALVFSSLEIFPDTLSLVVIPRKINLVARNFYFKNGFKISNYMHPGYNPERYIGYEWNR